MGMLAPLPKHESAKLADQQFIEYEEGLNVQLLMNIEKFEPIIHSGKIHAGDSEPAQVFMPKYTDIEGLRRYPTVLEEGEQVVLTEKLHGCNGRWLYHEGRFWVGSHNLLKKEDPVDTWWRAMRESGLDEKLKSMPSVVFYGEVLGVQDLRYGCSTSKNDVRIFDLFDVLSMRYVDYGEMIKVCEKLCVPVVPALYIGPWSDELRSHAEGKSTMADHVREGFVVRPLEERRNQYTGRTILKMVGEGYLLRKGG